jgi:hypothetical protein
MQGIRAQFLINFPRPARNSGVVAQGMKFHKGVIKTTFTLGGNEKLTIGLLTYFYEWVHRGVRNMVTALKIEIVSIAAAFAFMTGVLAAVW